MGAVHGVCYGVNGSNLPSRGDVVQLYKSNHIRGMRVYYPDHDALSALRGTGISLILDVGGVDKVRDLANNPSSAATFVQDNVTPYYQDVAILYIAVGNEVTGGDTQSLLPAMRNLKGALAAAGLNGIGVSTAVKFDVFDHTFPPSRGVFRDPSVMAPIAQFLASTGAPLLANVYPYFAYKDDQGTNISLDYATFRPGASPVPDPGSGLTYTCLFDAMVDAVYAALEKAGTPDVKVVVSESGWPSAGGGFGASVENARAYNQGMIDHVPNGTPKRGGALQTYVFAMFNEDLKPGEEIERHFGLFNPDKSPVYPITFPNN